MTGNSNTTEFDLVIVGAGAVGLGLVAALQNTTLRIAILDSKAEQPHAESEAVDTRSIALSYGSRLLLEAMHLWPSLAREAEAIKQIQVSQAGYFGGTRMGHKEVGVDALGYVIENQVLESCFRKVVAQAQNLTRYFSAGVKHVANQAAGVRLEVQTADEHLFIQARLLVIAVGAGSELMQRLNFPVQERHYEQLAVAANVHTEKPHGGVAYERFTASGPLALLPLKNQRSALIMTIKSCDEEDVKHLSDKAFLDLVADKFGRRMGRLFGVGPRAIYPLALREAEQQVIGRIVLLGNAARTLHPVAGQGLNLALRDVACLAERLGTSAARGGDIGASDKLQAFVRQRRSDQTNTIRLTDSLVSLFSNDFMPLAWARSAGLVALDRLPPLRKIFMRQALGLNTRLPRLPGPRIPTEGSL